MITPRRRPTIFESFNFAIEGIIHVLRTQRNMRIHFGVAVAVLVPALLMVSTIRFRSFKSFDLQTRRSYPALFVFAIVLALLASHTELVLLGMACSYLVAGLVGFIWGKVKKKEEITAAPAAVDESEENDTRQRKVE